MFIRAINTGDREQLALMKCSVEQNILRRYLSYLIN